MKTIAILLFSSLLLSSLFLQAQESWKRITPKPQENTLNCIVKIPGTNRLAAVGAGSTVMLSPDGGESWSLVLNPAGMNNRFIIKRIFFTNENTGFLIGGYQSILKTTDGGLHWEIKFKGDSVNDYNTLNDICFKDENNGFATGNNGLLLRTSDAGENWEVVSTGITGNLGSIVFADASTGFILAGSQLLKTTDGGTSWISIAMPSGLPNCYRMYFFDNGTGMAFGTTYSPDHVGHFYRTTDAGLTWTEVFSDPDLYDGIFSFFDGQNGVAGGNATYYKTKMFYTSDAGVTWSEGNTGLMPWNAANSILAIGQGNAIAVGAFGMIYKTGNYGADWFDALNRQLDGQLMDARFLSPKLGFALNESANSAVLFTSLSKTLDGGRSWSPVTTWFNYYPCFSFLSEDTGFLCTTEFGDVLRTFDGGTNWTLLTTNINATPEVFRFTSYNNGYLGWNGNLMHSTDGGETWNALSTGMEGLLNFNKFMNLDEDTLFIAGDDYEHPVLLRSFDGGANWETIIVEDEGSFSDICKAGGQIFFATSENHIYRSDDAGSHWVETTVMTENPVFFKSVYFPSADSGYAACYGLNENLFKTTDGGNIWQPVPTNITSGLNFVYFHNTWSGLVLGDLGVAAVTEDGGITAANEYPEAREAGFQIYPNPCNDLLNISMTGSSFNEIKRVQIIDASGTHSWFPGWEKAGSSFKVDVRELSCGFYLLQLLQPDGQTFHFRFVRR